MENANIVVVGFKSTDVSMILIACQKSEMLIDCYSCLNDSKAKTFLRDEYRRMPDLLLVDMDHDVESSLGLLREIKATTSTCQTPVIMFSSSGINQYFSVTYEESCAGFLHKPSDCEKCVYAIGIISNYWFVTAQRPMLATW